MNRTIAPADLIERRRNFSRQLRVVISPQQRILVVGNGNIDVGNPTPTRKPGQPIIENLAATDGSTKPRIDQPSPLTKAEPRICVAMTQQCGDSGRGNQSVPLKFLQKFLQLVGYRDPKARIEPWVRPRPAPVKR